MTGAVPPSPPPRWHARDKTDALFSLNFHGSSPFWGSRFWVLGKLREIQSVPCRSDVCTGLARTFCSSPNSVKPLRCAHALSLNSHQRYTMVSNFTYECKPHRLPSTPTITAVPTRPATCITSRQRPTVLCAPWVIRAWYLLYCVH